MDSSCNDFGFTSLPSHLLIWAYLFTCQTSDRVEHDDATSPMMSFRYRFIEHFWSALYHSIVTESAQQGDFKGNDGELETSATSNVPCYIVVGPIVDEVNKRYRHRRVCIGRQIFGCDFEDYIEGSDF